MNPTAQRTGSGGPASWTSGFTILELVVVMGILSGFLVMLVQLVDSGLRLFRDGEVEQQLADRASHAQHVFADELRQLRGSVTGRDSDTAADRLVVQMLPIGLPERPELGATRVQVLRGAVHLSRDRELALREVFLLAQVQAEKPDAPPVVVEAEVAKRKLVEPLRGIGNLLLLPWRQENADDAMLELRAGWFLPGQTLPVGPDRAVDPFGVIVPGSADLPSLVLYRNTTPILQNLLHVEFLLWSQRTTTWGQDGEVGLQGEPERIWDSARGGWLIDGFSGGAWPLDRGAQSLDDPLDDIQPHAILVRCVVAQPAEIAPEGVLASELGADEDKAFLLAGDRFPGPRDGGWLKIRGEWIRYAERDGDVLRGLQRGQRFTKALEHPAGTRVHVGRTVEFVVPVAHAKDDWNG